MTDTASGTADKASDLWRAMVDTWNGPARDTPRSAETGQPMPTDQNAQETGT